MAIASKPTATGTRRDIVLPDADVIRIRFADLTDRQREVALLVAEGYSQPEIAARLGLTVSTIDNHAHTGRRLMRCRDRVELCRHLTRAGLVTL